MNILNSYIQVDSSQECHLILDQVHFPTKFEKMENSIQLLLRKDLEQHNLKLHNHKNIQIHKYVQLYWHLNFTNRYFMSCYMYFDSNSNKRKIQLQANHFQNQIQLIQVMGVVLCILDHSTLYSINFINLSSFNFKQLDFFSIDANLSIQLIHHLIFQNTLLHFLLLVQRLHLLIKTNFIYYSRYFLIKI